LRESVAEFDVAAIPLRARLREAQREPHEYLRKELISG
jgi:hypothetical protein